MIDERGDRLSHSRQRIPFPVLVLSIVASFIWLIPFFALDFQNRGLGGAFVSGVTFIVVSIILIIIDLDDPVTGTWIVDLDSWEELIKIIPC
jgi:hypothetical protein